MKKYRVLLKGLNFLLNFEGQPRRSGFYTTRFVEADTPHEAENRAVQLIRVDQGFQAVVTNERSDPPMIYLEEIEELESFEGVEPSGKGYTFFADSQSKSEEEPTDVDA